MAREHPRWGIEFDWLAVDSQHQVAMFTSAGDFSSWLTTAQRGFFTYDWTVWHGPYKRLAIPSVPIILEPLSKSRGDDHTE
jgi:hypothetical protein